MVLSMPPWHIWPLAALGFSLFYTLFAGTKTSRQAALCGWLFGFGYFVFGLSWIANALLIPGNTYAWAWPLAAAGLPALLAFFPACAFGLTRKIVNAPDSLSGFLFFVAAFCIFEWLRGHIFTGFPWNLAGYTWGGTLSMAQICALIGIYGLTFLSVLWFTLPGFLLVGNPSKRARIILIALTVVTAGGAFIYGAHRLSAHPTLLRDDILIYLVQPNIPEEHKWNPQKTADNFHKLLKLSDTGPGSEGKTTLIVWPETAVSDYLLANKKASAALHDMLSRYKDPVYILAGILRHEDGKNADKKDTRYFNSLVVFDSNALPVATYDKSHLVPFGEYIPFQKFTLLKPIVNFSGFVQGPGPQTLRIPGIPSFSPLVCYEIIFPGAVVNSHDRPDFIVNVTNDAWYGDSAGPRQHFAMTRFRAIETGIPVIRSANTGLSGATDAYGRILYISRLFIDDNYGFNLPQGLESQTVYSSYGDVLFFLFVSLVAIVATVSAAGNKRAIRL